MGKTRQKIKEFIEKYIHKGTAPEVAKRREKQYVKTDRKVLLGEIGVSISCYSILAGLTFTASILFFSSWKEVSYGKWFAMLGLVTAFLFIGAAMLAGYVSTAVRRGELRDAYYIDKISKTFGFVGFMLMTLELTFMAFNLLWELGVIFIVILFLCLTYVAYRVLVSYRVSWYREFG